MAMLTLLIILDGWGIGDARGGNAIAIANTPNMDEYYKNYPYTTLACSGEDVGLPEGQMGNSEVGHLNIGAGRIVYQELTRISKAIRDDSFFENDELLKAMRFVKERGTALHLMGLLSDGGVHSHIDHLFALLEMAYQNGVKDVYIHAFLDGRDVPPSNAKEYVKLLEQKCQELAIGKIATISGRYYAMDRDKRWKRTKKAYDAMVNGAGEISHSAIEAIANSYDKGETDEFIRPTVIVDDQQNPTAAISNGDAVVFYNFRPDRARQLTRAFIEKGFNEFNLEKNRPEVYFVAMTEYDRTFDIPVAFKPQKLKNVLGEVLSRNNIRQLKIAETEKYAHVTFFLNGGREIPYEGEDRILIPSPKVSTYDLKPEMSAYEVADTCVEKIQEGDHQVIIVNFANADMVGHTGNLQAAVKAVEVVDDCVGRLVDAALQRGGTIMITADHGNAEKMLDKDGNPCTAHTCNKVPFILLDGGKWKMTSLKRGRLADIAPTMLRIIGIDKPEEMTGDILII